MKAKSKADVLDYRLTMWEDGWELGALFLSLSVFSLMLGLGLCNPQERKTMLSFKNIHKQLTCCLKK